MKELQQVFIEDINELRAWLEKNHTQVESVWLLKWKKNFGKTYISYDDIVDELMCFGWVDSLPRKFDDQKTMLLISPRNPKSNWSKVNKDRVTRLNWENRMQSPGIKMLKMAKEAGTWDALNDVENLIIPPDLAEAFEKDNVARRYFERFPDSSKRGILEWINNAKKDETRQKRISETVLKASINIKANHPKGRDAGPKE